MPVPGGTAALAQALGIEPAPDRGRFVYEISRLLYNAPEGRKPSADRYLAAARQSIARDRPSLDTRPGELVPVPLTADVWSRAIFHRTVAPRDLVTAIITDRAAALLCLGLASLDDATLGFFAEHPQLLERLYARSAPAFSAFSASLRVQNSRVVPPSGDAAVALWETLTIEKVTRPERFVQQLFEVNDGRIAYLYDVIGALDPARRAFALGLWIANPTARAERFKALALGIGGFREAHLRTLPLGRASYDLSMTLSRVAVAADGTPAAPAMRGFWARVFASSDLPDDAARVLRGVDDEPFDAAWLIDAIAPVDVRIRAERLDQLAFGQRLFGGADAAARPDVFVAVRALARYRMLMWTFERIGIRAPAIYANGARQAARVGAFDGRRGFEAQAQFQGALAILARIASVGTLTPARTQPLIEQLVALPLTDDGRYMGAIARWLRGDLAAAIAGAETSELAVLAAMSGPPSGDGPIARTVTWEGQSYRLDLGAAERRRLAIVRDKQAGAPLDAALDLAAAARSLASDKLAIADVEAILDKLTAVAGDLPRRVGRDTDDIAPGISSEPNARESLRKVTEELAKDIHNKDVKHVARAAVPLAELSDRVLAGVLLSIAYAADVGDPDGTVLLAEDVSRRHDFGFSGRDSEVRLRMAWAVPRVEVIPGVPWHVSGSLLGLDIGLAPLALRRLNFERVLEPPRLTSNERDTFAVSVSLLNPFKLRDADRDAIGDTIARGQRRLGALRNGGQAGARADADAAFEAIADELSIEGWRRRAVRWMLVHDADRVASMFSLGEILVLGGGRTPDLDTWGMSMMTLEGCVCSRLTPPGRWPTLLGRPPLGLTASAVADVHLHVALMLREMRLPAAIAKVVLSGAVQDFIDEAKPTDDADWLTLVRSARAANRDRIEDYIAAATAAGPFVPDTGRRVPDRQ
ncbi:MAG: hypothetical protein JWL71_1951 [Acidobacteria bacterium]|nr:hypothetical protein [Acidobacteriota bacterium]